AETSTYIVKVTDASGCFSTDSVTVFVNDVKCGDLFVPNAFSPNGDGQNDILFVRANCTKELSFTIYDRWGNKVFETSDVVTGWDGKYKGTAMNTAVFV